MSYLDPKLIYSTLSSKDSDDIDVLSLVIHAVLPIFWPNHPIVTLDSTLKYKVPYPNRLFGCVIVAIGKRFKYSGNSVDEFLEELSNLNGPDFSPFEAISHLDEFVPNLKIAMPLNTAANLDAYYTTYFITALYVNTKALQNRI